MPLNPVAFPRPRTLAHPGPFDPVRIRSMHSHGAKHVRLQLQPGLTLLDSIVKPLYALGIENASMTILGGIFSHLEYCVAPPDPTGQAVIAYTQPIIAGRACMIFGNATLGKGAQDRPLVHCHAVVRTHANQIKGGHIITDESVIGSEPISVLVTSLDDFELRVAFDPETNIPLLKPHQEKNHV